MIDRERKMLQKIKKKQEDEILKLIEQEMIKQERNKKNSEKSKIQQEKELRRRLEVEEHHRKQE